MANTSSEYVWLTLSSRYGDTSVCGWNCLPSEPILYFSDISNPSPVAPEPAPPTCVEEEEGACVIVDTSSSSARAELLVAVGVMGRNL